MSEGDNSVFSEGGTTPLEQNIAPDDKQDQDASGNESEEVDDIELIFTTDESKDMSNLQASDHTKNSAFVFITIIYILNRWMLISF